jgi:hypothetical protein
MPLKASNHTSAPTVTVRVMGRESRFSTRIRSIGSRLISKRDKMSRNNPSFWEAMRAANDPQYYFTGDPTYKLSQSDYLGDAAVNVLPFTLYGATRDVGGMPKYGTRFPRFRKALTPSPEFSRSFRHGLAYGISGYTGVGSKLKSFRRASPKKQYGKKSYTPRYPRGHPSHPMTHSGKASDFVPQMIAPASLNPYSYTGQYAEQFSYGSLSYADTYVAETAKSALHAEDVVRAQASYANVPPTPLPWQSSSRRVGLSPEGPPG